MFVTLDVLVYMNSAKHGFLSDTNWRRAAITSVNETYSSLLFTQSNTVQKVA
uniref:Uncharacterized protein n=1 Tax=Arundo donax TaxID=35708 RepID=A0A0A9C1U9_ARUDO